ncbi:hypothetical protein HK104_008748 [Borealophlyctis nickersoniae]|nr:hypothetical protein HK104_008748 [Borealophlyctis nickersoniae]
MKEYLASLEKWSDNTKEALDLLRNQSKYYAIVEVKGQPYHVHLHDIIIAQRINELQLGDVIELDRVWEIGSDDFMLQGNPFILPSYYTIKCVVTEHPYSKEIVRVHKKRRAKNTVLRNFDGYTALRVTEIKINKPAA